MSEEHEYLLHRIEALEKRNNELEQDLNDLIRIIANKENNYGWNN